MATGVVTWSKTAASNANSDSAQNWAEGMPAPAVNDSARGGMASVAKWRDDLNGTLSTGGTSTVYTLSTNQGFAALAAGLQVTFALDETNGATVTLNVDSLGAKPLRSAPNVELAAGVLATGAIYTATYATSNSGEWLLHSIQGVADATITAAKLASDAVTTVKILDKNVTYAKIQDVTATNRLLGRLTTGAGVVEELTIGAGLTNNGTTLKSAFPPPAAFKNLSIKVASNTTVTVAADFVTTTDGTTYQTTALSGTVNMGTNGAANALDAGFITNATWYAIWAIAKADGTTAALASTSGTAPTLPTDYTFKARIGWVRTNSGSAQLHGTWQLGRRAQYIVGLAQTTATRIMATGPTGDLAVPTWTAVTVSNHVPSTASEILGSALSNGNGYMIAPNNSYGAWTSTTNPPPIAGNGASTNPINLSFCFLLESTNIYWAANATTSLLLCHGWVDNI